MNFKPICVLRTGVLNYWAVSILEEESGINIWVDLKLNPEDKFLDATWNETILSLRKLKLTEYEETIYLDYLDDVADVAIDALYNLDEIYHGEDGDWYSNVNNWKEKSWWIMK